jgi:predicted SAM-dependent methyltransferase
MKTQAEKVRIKMDSNKKYLNLGCGLDIRDGWTNVDFQKGKGICKSFDLTKFPYPFGSDTFDYILLDNVFEHLLFPEKILPELWRIAKNKATIRIIVPYYNHKSAYNDITHYHYFNKRTFENLFDYNVSYVHNPQTKFLIQSIFLNPTKFGKLIPNFVREKTSQYLGNIYRTIDVKILVKK